MCWGVAVEGGAAAGSAHLAPLQCSASSVLACLAYRGSLWLPASKVLLGLVDHFEGRLISEKELAGVLS